MRTPRDWSCCFFDMALAIAQRSKDDSTQAGAVLVNKHKRVMGTGFNGPPPSINDEEVPWGCRDPEQPNKYQYIIHAEENCILDALSKANREDIEGSTMYCTHSPCIGCVLRLIHAGVRNLFFRTPYTNGQNQEHIARLLDSQKIAYYTHGPLWIGRIAYDPSSTARQ